MNLIDDRAERP